MLLATGRTFTLQKGNSWSKKEIPGMAFLLKNGISGGAGTIFLLHILKPSLFYIFFQEHKFRKLHSILNAKDVNP